MSKIKYKFTLTYQTKNLRDISNLLDKCDLGIDGFWFEESYTFSGDKDYSIEYLKEMLKKFMEECECTVLKIEGGKWV